MSKFIYVIRKINNNEPHFGDYRFINKRELEIWLKTVSEKCEIQEYQYGFINPDNEDLCIHKLDSKTIKILMSDR